jgi:hypothetical protein
MGETDMSQIKVLVLIALLAGCATMRNTPQQDATYALFAECRAETNSSAKLRQVYPNGSFTWVKGSDTSDDGMTDCMVRKGRKFEWVNTPRGAWGGSSGNPERTKTVFEACRTETGYASATLTELNPDGGFRYRGDDPEANKAFKVCLRDKGLRIY